MPQQPAGTPQQPGGMPQEPRWGPQPVWAPPAARGQPPSNRPLLLVVLAVLLIGLVGLVYWQFGDRLSSLFSSTPTTTADTTPPIISNISVVASDISARIDWETDELASTQVEYGTTASYELGSTTLEDDPASATSIGVLPHSVVLEDLDPETTYHYRVKSKDAAGNLAVSGDDTFTTEAEESAEE